MKAIVSILITAVFFLAACSTSNQTSVPYDDVYYSVDIKKTPQSEQTVKTRTTYTSDAVKTSEEYIYKNSEGEEVEYVDERDYSDYEPSYETGEAEGTQEGDVEVNNYYYDEEFEYDDYYDYSYTARIRRFHSTHVGYSYYDPYFTNLYWYDYDPWHWGSSIYLGYPWWSPYRYYDPFFYRPGFRFGFSWGWGNMYWGFPYSWGYPYGYGGYWTGYWHGYYDGFYYPHYYNSFDHHSHYYGHRGSRGGATNGYFASNSRGSRSFGDKYEAKYGTARGTRSLEERSTGARTGRSLSQGNKATNEAISTQRTVRPGDGQNTKVQKERISPTNESRTRISKPATKENISRERQAQEKYRQTDKYKYQKPTRTNPEKTYRKPKTYQTPDYRQKRSSQEYTVPKSSNNKVNRGTVKSNTNKAPRNTNFTKPKRTNTRTYTPPKRSNNSRSYTPPSRSSGSKSYSAPSRSSSSGSSSRSSGSSSRSSGGSRGRR